MHGFIKSTAPGVALGPLGCAIAIHVLLVVEAPLEHVAGEDGRLRVVEHGDHAADGQCEELVRPRADTIVNGSDGLGSAHAGKVEVLGVVIGEARAAADDGRRGLRGDIVAKGGVARLAADANHARQHCGPLVKVGLELDLLDLRDEGPSRRGRRRCVAIQVGRLDRLRQLRKLERVDCARKRCAGL
mgnify:CR=1 FL=1